MQSVTAPPGVVPPASVPSIIVPGSQFALSMYGPIFFPLMLAQAYLSGVEAVPTGYSAASGAQPPRSQAEDPNSNSGPS